MKDVLLDSASNFTVFWESLPDSDLLRIPGDDLQKYHQMIQAAKHSLSLTCSRNFFLDDFCSLLELLVRVWLGWDSSLRRWPAKRQIIFEIELSENSVKNARKTADFGIELSENFNRWPGPTLLCLHSLVHGLSESKGFSLISGRGKKWIGKESESENRAIPTEFARNSRVFFFSNSFFFPMSYRAESFWFG